MGARRRRAGSGENLAASLTVSDSVNVTHDSGGFSQGLSTPSSSPLPSANHPRNASLTAANGANRRNRAEFSAQSACAPGVDAGIRPPRRRTAPPVSARRMRGGVSRVTGNFSLFRAESKLARAAPSIGPLINLEGSMGYCSSRHFAVFPRNRYLIQRNRDRNASEQGSESVGTGILFARPRGQLRQRMSEATVGSSGPCRFERVDLFGPEQRQARVHQRSEGHADRLAAREDRAL